MSHTDPGMLLFTQVAIIYFVLSNLLWSMLEVYMHANGGIKYQHWMIANDSTNEYQEFTKWKYWQQSCHVVYYRI